MASNLARANMELRHLKASMLDKLASIIDQGNGLEQLLNCLTRPLPPEVCGQRMKPLNLSQDQIDIIKKEFHRDKSPALALLKHWSITGRIRPTVLTLLAYLKFSKLERAAAYVVQEIICMSQYPQNVLIKEDKLPQIMDNLDIFTSTITIDDNDTGYMIDEEFKFDDLSDLMKKFQNEHRLFSFRAIYESTNRFCHRPYDPNTNVGTRIGDGRFSSVFRANINTNPNGPPQIVAAKLLKSESDRDYLVNELKLAKRIKHANVLDLLGISINTDSEPMNYLCLVYPYIQNGSLQRCLSQGLMCSNLSFLSCEQRFRIAVGVAEGINYLHNFEDKPIIHRDIKTANILIDIDANPKIGDFTLVRQLEYSPGGDTRYTSSVIGTSIYMPPEAFRGDISTKFDIYSFGVVLLELLTGMKPFNEISEEDLLTYISEKLVDIDEQSGGSEVARDEFLKEILDHEAGQWNLAKAKIVFTLALKATESRKAHRPIISEILADLKTLEKGSFD